MPVPVNELEPVDFEILRYINEFDRIHKDQITRKLSKKVDALDFRVDILSKMDHTRRSYDSGSCYIETEYSEHATNEHGFGDEYPTGFYFISPRGKKALQDYKVKRILNRRMKAMDWVRVAISAFGGSLLTFFLHHFGLLP